MNWVAVKERENNFSIHSQRLLSLSDICVSSLSKSLRYAFELRSTFTTPHRKCGIEDIVIYFRSFPWVSNSTHYVMPYWISDLLFTQDENCPIDIFEEFFSHKICSLSNIRLRHCTSGCIRSRLSHLKHFHLTKLDLSMNGGVFSSHFKLLIRSKVSHSLGSLKLRGCGNFKDISTLFCFKNLKELDLSENNFLIWGPINSLSKRLSLILSSFTQLQILDLHFTNFCSSCPVRFMIKSSNPVIHANLQELYLFRKISGSHLDGARHVKHICKFYEYLAKLPSLTHLDLSGWPYFDKVPKNTLTVFGKKCFFSLYGTQMTDKFSDITILCEEITTLWKEKYLISAISHDYTYVKYMNNLIHRIYDHIVKDSVKYSKDISIKLIVLMLDTLDYLMPIFPLNHTSLSWSIELMHDCTVCLYVLECSTRPKIKINNTLVRRSFETSIILLHKIGVDALTNVRGVSFIVLYIIEICYKLTTTYSLTHLHQTWSYFLVKFLLAVIVKVCEEPNILHFHANIPKIIALVLHHILYLVRFSFDKTQKAYIGIELGGLDILMRFIHMKLTANSLDEDLSIAADVLLNITYLCLPNCLRLCTREHRDTLIRALSHMTSQETLMCQLMTSIKIVGDFCLENTSTAVSYRLLHPVIIVLWKSANYNFGAVAHAITFTTYFSMGHEKWGWKESGEEALSLAADLIVKLDYREIYDSQRFIFHNTLDFLVECLEAYDRRIMLCAVWIICNLVHTKPKSYLNLLSEEAIKMIHGILSSYFPTYSIYHKQYVMKMFEITTKCAELN